MIAIALACEPEILIADEPTTALDVTVQAEIFDLLRDIGTQTETAMIMITHDMGAVRQMAQRMLVMYAGRKVEEGSVDKIIKSPSHPYTKGLISCVPHLREGTSKPPKALPEIDGIVPDITGFGKDKCLFAPRCGRVTKQCLDKKPENHTVAKAGQHFVSCWHPHGKSA